MCLLSPRTPPFPSFYISFFLKRKKKNPASALLKPIPPPSTFLLSSCYSTLGWGLRDEGLSDWVSAHQLERQAFFSLHRLGSSIFSFPFPVKCWPSIHFLLGFNDFSPRLIFFVLMCPSAPPQCSSPLLSFCVLCCTGTSIYQCQSPVLKLNRLAHIDYH